MRDATRCGVQRSPLGREAGFPRCLADPRGDRSHAAHDVAAVSARHVMVLLCTPIVRLVRLCTTSVVALPECDSDRGAFTYTYPGTLDVVAHTLALFLHL